MKPELHQIVITKVENGNLKLLGMNKDGTQECEELDLSNDFFEALDELIGRLTCPSQ